MARRGRKTHTQHDAAIIAGVAAGKNLPQIAREIGVPVPKLRNAARRLCLKPADARKDNRGRPPCASTFYDADVRRLASQGLTRRQIAENINVNVSTIGNVVRRLGVAVSYENPIEPDQSRADRMAERYKAGETLQRIGYDYGLTRERVRQILRKRTPVLAIDGGAAVVNARRRRERASKLDEKYMARLGCGWAEYKRIREVGREAMRRGRHRDRTPMGAFLRQRHNASVRGIGWTLTFWDWWSIWQASGRWEQRGRGQGYVMCRRNDEGPYAAENVFIATAIENTSSGKHKKSGLPTGVRATKSGRFTAQRRVGGKVLGFGTFDTPAQAYAAYVAAAPGLHRTAPIFRETARTQA